MYKKDCGIWDELWEEMMQKIRRSWSHISGDINWVNSVDVMAIADDHKGRHCSFVGAFPVLGLQQFSLRDGRVKERLACICRFVGAARHSSTLSLSSYAAIATLKMFFSICEKYSGWFPGAFAFVYT